MSFSEKMRHGLGAEGAHLEVAVEHERIAPGETLTGAVTVTGGTKPAQIDVLTVRLVQADRQWKDRDGNLVPEQVARELPDRTHLTAAWDRKLVQQQRMAVGRTVEPGATERIEFRLQVPAECPATHSACTYTLNVQADIKGQIDPTANARVTIG